jgi:hypothetical protein
MRPTFAWVLAIACAACGADLLQCSNTSALLHHDGCALHQAGSILDRAGRAPHLLPRGQRRRVRRLASHRSPRARTQRDGGQASLGKHRAC